MKTQQAAEREEQQRIKNLVLNYDLRDGDEQDGDLQNPIPINYNIHTRNAGIDKTAGASYSRSDKSVNNRSGQRARKLQISDIDWYDNKTPPLVTYQNLLPSSPSAKTHQNSLSSPSGEKVASWTESFPELVPTGVAPTMPFPPNASKTKGRGKGSRRVTWKTARQTVG